MEKIALQLDGRERREIAEEPNDRTEYISPEEVAQ